ncbi:unnamed protein product [Closterium sp. NIES-65]|nr:unnamed protein product [Closterium sp. NIES-65]CAI5997938.1 unnamed protein product [Closterium sp. NIES-65]
MPAGVAEPAAVEEVGGMRTCSAGYGEGQAQGWCAQTSAEDANGAASPGLTSGERFGLPETLRNRYVLLRHGRSLANERGLIVSSLENGVAAEFGLAAEGRQQAQRAGRQLSELLEQRGVAGRDVVVLASPFSRTQQTAALAAKELGIHVLGTRFQTAEELRERYFGRHLELNSHDLVCALLPRPLSPSLPCSLTRARASHAHQQPDIFALYCRPFSNAPALLLSCILQLCPPLSPPASPLCVVWQYPAVWVDDRKDAAFRPGGDGESVVAVAQRTARLIRHIEEDLDGWVDLHAQKSMHAWGALANEGFLCAGVWQIVLLHLKGVNKLCWALANEGFLIVQESGGAGESWRYSTDHQLSSLLL